VPDAQGPLTKALGRASYESMNLDLMLAQPGRPLALTPAVLIPEERP
jgi:hypothetical protein